MLIFKRSLRDWFVFGLGLLGLISDYILSRIFNHPSVAPNLLFVCSILATIMGGVGLPISALKSKYSTASRLELTGRQLLRWTVLFVTLNALTSGVIAPYYIHYRATFTLMNLWSVLQEFFVDGIIGALPWMIMHGLAGAGITILFVLILRSIFLQKDEVATRTNTIVAARVGILAFLVSGTFLTPLGTIAWAIAETNHGEEIIITLQRLLLTTMGVAIACGLILHYLMLSLTVEHTATLLNFLELVVGFVAFFSITMTLYQTVGIINGGQKDVSYLLLLPQFVNAFVVTYYSTLWLVAVICKCPAKKSGA